MYRHLRLPGILLSAFLLTVPLLNGQSLEEIERSTVEVDNILERARASDSDTEKERLATQTLNMARSLRYDGGIIRSSIVLGEVSARTGKTEQALQYYLEAEAKVISTGNKVAQLSVQTALGDLFLKEKLYANARRYYHEVLVLQPNDYRIKEKIADACLLDMRFDSAEFFYKELIVKYKEEGNNARLVQIYQKLANAYDQNGDAGKSLYYYLPIEDLVERFGTSQERGLLYNNLGRQYAALRDFPKALEYFQKAELQCVYITCDYPEVMFANMGIALHNTGDTKKGIEYLLKAQAILAARGDKAALANLEHLIATVYFSNNDLYNALTHNTESIRFAKETKQYTVLADAYRTSADLYHDLYDFEKAFEFYRDYLNILDSVRLEEQSRLQRLNQQRTLLAAAEGQIKFLITRQNIKDLELSQERFERERLELLNKNLELVTRRSEDEVLLLQKQKEVDQAQLREQTLQALRARQDLRLAAQNFDAEKQQRIIAELRQQEKIDSAQGLARSRELDLLRRDKDIAQLELDKQANFQRFAYGVGGLLLVILGLLAMMWLFARRTSRRLKGQNKKIQTQNREIEEERRKSDVLLRNILPDEVAQELKTRGYATPHNYESATVVFTDFVNFTRLSTTLRPKELIDELDTCFLAFDEICDRHGLEKIKTIGDAYMCAGGLPIANETHPFDAVRAALEMCKWLEDRNRNNPNAIFRYMRIGIHTGPVVAGVIGKNKFAYDIWGDAVNLASRLEALGEPNRINISEETADIVKDQFRLTFRGQKEVHNKGLVGMYFVEA
ncbi:MAG TPA: adenylate/guanylate cyclase domain-containing protein [Saprospiraceae bacterium]|nr:adenylate/guanylate cyclase domain-containing protein [Saprospiraceae bacterium]HPI08644.1 adenylate/guanylate cyclase domain-containing protein [Saprospiraceae bacterium]